MILMFIFLFGALMFIFLFSRYHSAKDRISEHCNSLQTTLSHSQGLEERLVALQKWLVEIEPNVSAARPIPLNKEKLGDQVLYSRRFRFIEIIFQELTHMVVKF